MVVSMVFASIVAAVAEVDWHQTCPIYACYAADMVLADDTLAGIVAAAAKVSLQLPVIVRWGAGTLHALLYLQAMLYLHAALYLHDPDVGNLWHGQAEVGLAMALLQFNILVNEAALAMPEVGLPKTHKNVLASKGNPLTLHASDKLLVELQPQMSLGANLRQQPVCRPA